MDNDGNREGGNLGQYIMPIFLALVLSQMIGCAIRAEREGDTLILRGLGAKKAVWADGASIEKEEPLHVPNLIPSR